MTSPQNVRPILSDKRRLLEITAVITTAVGKFIFMDWLQWRLPFILAVIFGWSTYVLYRTRKVPGILPYWGFRFDTFKKAMLLILPFGIISVIAFFLIGYYCGTLNLTWHIFPILLLYPIWGCMQQFLVISLVAGNLQDLNKYQFHKMLIILIAASLFGLMHYPHGWLILGTFVLALLYGFIYLKVRNVYVMGIFHGWLGGLFFYTVVGRDPFVQVFGKLLSL